ncbi:hypothetical protein AAF712_009143 [Marasmius tenuissimus]|uniref:Uncharacterized protein n=1 Tax=Marasmius tenuissimus TaxID=585030 RepID=A0ABR2ZRC8_9AGAR
MKIATRATYTSDIFSLISTCSKLYNAYRLEVVPLVIDRLDIEKVYALKVPVKGRVKSKKISNTLDKPYRPLVFSGNTSKTDDGDLVVSVILPTFLRGDSYGQAGDVVIEENNVMVVDPEGVDIENETEIDLFWDKECRGNVVEMDGQMLRNNWNCPECRNTRFICPGCGGVSGR